MNKQVMNKQFVSYQQALTLKELGFKEPCFGWYNWTGKDLSLKDNSYVDIDPTPAPTFSQAFEFFRDKYSLHIVVNIGIPHDNLNNSKKTQYFFNVIKFGNHHKNKYRSTFYKTYGELEIESLNKLIEIIKSKNDGR